MPANWMENGLAAIFAANNPDAFAEYAAAKGVEPPTGGVEGLGTGPVGPSLAGLLDPQPQSAFAGVTAPQAPEAVVPSPPGVPSGGGQINQQAALLELLRNPPLPPVSPVGGLAQYLGR